MGIENGRTIHKTEQLREFGGEGSIPMFAFFRNCNKRIQRKKTLQPENGVRKIVRKKVWKRKRNCQKLNEGVKGGERKGGHCARGT